MLKNRISGLLHYHSQHRTHVVNLLDEGKSHLKSIIEEVEEKIRQFDAGRERNLESSQRDLKLDESECRDVHVSNVGDRRSVAEVCWSFPCLTFFSPLFSLLLPSSVF